MEKDIQFKGNEKMDDRLNKDERLKKQELDDQELDGVAGGTDVLELVKTIKDIIVK